MSAIPITYLGRTTATPIAGKKVTSKGSKKNRISLDNKKGCEIALVSRRFFVKPPKATWKEKLFSKKPVILHVQNVQTSKGTRTGYMKVNAESFRKRLGLSKEEFKQGFKASRDMTSFVPVPINEPKEKEGRTYIQLSAHSTPSEKSFFSVKRLILQFSMTLIFRFQSPEKEAADYQNLLAEIGKIDKAHINACSLDGEQETITTLLELASRIKDEMKRIEVTARLKECGAI